jgi:16S rRNA (guanine527-N7)-methyltransferase
LEYDDKEELTSWQSTGETPGANLSSSTDMINSPSAFVQAFEVSHETLENLTKYAGLLAQWQKAVNLVAPSTLAQVWHRHIADSAQIVSLVPADARTFADLGSGGGFPALVLAIMLAGREPRRPFTMSLIESDIRKGAFLREVIRQTGLKNHGNAVEILSIRIENSVTQSRVGAVDVVTARALASLDRLFQYAFPLFHPGTVGLFLKGRDTEREMDEAQARWSFTARLIPSRTEPDASVVVVTHLSPKLPGHT